MQYSRAPANYATLLPMDPHTFAPAERAVFRRLTTPEKIQRFLDDLAYNKEHDGETCRSPRRVLRDRTAHCMEGALFGAAALRMLGHPPLLLDFEAVRDDDHVLAIFQRTRPLGRAGQIQLLRPALSRAGLPHPPRARHELLRALLQPQTREDAAQLFAAGQPAPLRFAFTG